MNENEMLNEAREIRNNIAYAMQMTGERHEQILLMCGEEYSRASLQTTQGEMREIKCFEYVMKTFTLPNEMYVAANVMGRITGDRFMREMFAIKYAMSHK